MRLHSWLAAKGVAAIVFCTPFSALSQTVAPSLATEASISSHDQLEEITVRAERRSERLQDVPIEVAVLSADDARKMNITDSLGLSTQVPGLATSRQITGATIYMRGVGTIASAGNENVVATYVDDVYINGFSGSNVPLFNMDHVEVLKGPQGTLFGRNATGGVINIITKDPEETPSLDARVGYANYDTYSANVYGTAAIVPTLAVNVSFDYRNQRDGFGHDLITHQPIYLGEEYGVRTKLKWQPSDRTSVVLAVESHYDNSDFGLNANVAPGTLSLGGGTYAGPYNAQVVNALSGGIDGQGAHENGESLTAQHEFGWGTLKSISAARVVSDTVTYDQDMGPAHIVDAFYNTKMEMYTEELHLASPNEFSVAGHDFHWLTGLFVMKMNDALRPLGIAGAAVGDLERLNATSASYTRTYAGFLDGTFAITHEDNITFGARYTDDRIINRANDEFIVAGGSSSTAFPTQYSNSKRPTYRLVLDHKVSSDVMVYASASTGFKSGGFNLFSAGTAPVRPETLDAFAVGLKSEWLDRKLQANLEAFDYKYLNQQVAVIRNGGQFDINAARSRIYGLDASFVARALPDLVLRTNLEYLRGRYARFPDAPIVLQEPATCDPTPMRLPGPLQPGGLTCSFDASGKATIRSPSFSGNLSGDYYLHTPVGSVDFSANYYYTSSYNWDTSGQYPEPAYGLLSTGADWTSLSQRWSVGLFCSNCLNRYHDTFIAESAPAMQRAAEPPRQYGVRFSVHLGPESGT